MRPHRTLDRTVPMANDSLERDEIGRGAAPLPSAADLRLRAPPPTAPRYRRRGRPWLLRYGVAVLSVAVATVLTFLLKPVIAHQFALIFFAAVPLSAWFGGIGPGTLSALLSVAAIDYLFIEPVHIWSAFSTQDAVGFVVFVLVAILTSTLSESLRVQREHAEARALIVQRLSAELEARAALRLEEKIHEAETLAAELARSNEALRRKTAEAEAATDAKSQFLAAVSHEVRAPLSAIAGYAGLLASGVRGPLTAEQQHDLERILYSQRHLLTLINDLLDLAKAEAGHVTLSVSDVAVADVVAQARSLIDPQRASKGLTFESQPLDGIPFVRADPERLVQVLVNLLSNAVKFTETGMIGIRAEVSETQIGLSVWDTGRGIAPEHQDRIFEPFVQADVTDSEEKRGTGLGLAISRDFVRAMGGDITLTSTPGEGSVFTVWLPRADAAPPVSRPAHTNGHGRVPIASMRAGVADVWPPAFFWPLVG